MVQKKGGGQRVSDDAEEDLSRVPYKLFFWLIASLRNFVLLPLVNVPMIEYTLAWLESAGVEEVFVFCCAHAKQVIEYLEKSQWFSQPNFSVTTIESHNSVSAGDIHGDFVLISGDTVSNMSLAQVLQEHKDRRKKDSDAVMTMVIKTSKPSPITRQSRLGTDELFMAIDPNTKQLLYYEDRAEHTKGTISLDKTLIADHPSISLYNDKQDCYIDICSQEVLSLFTDNFDYQHLRRHFVKGLLVDDIMGYKIFTHEIHSSYAARIDNYRSYDIISKDIIQRWTYPLVPDVQFFGNAATKLERRGVYQASDVAQSRYAEIGPFTVIGSGTSIGNNTAISNSVIGEGCTIGSNISIEGSYVWNNVTIEDGCKLKEAIVCDGVVLKSGATLEPGVVVSFKVIIGERCVIPAYSKVSLLPQPIKQDSDEELEYADEGSGIVETPSITSLADKLDAELKFKLSEMPHWSSSELGTSGGFYIWSLDEGGLEEEWRHSVAHIPADKLAALLQAAEDDLEVSAQDGNVLPPSGELDANTENSEDDLDDLKDDSVYFEREVEATFLRAVHENVVVDNVILEVNSLQVCYTSRLSYNMSFVDCAGAIFYSIMKLALETPHNSTSELRRNAVIAIITWEKLLKHYLQSIDEEIEVILKFEEMCLESAKEFAPLFAQILHLLYDKDILQEEAILSWASEKEGADDTDKVFLKQVEQFIQVFVQLPKAASGSTKHPKKKIEFLDEIHCAFKVAEEHLTWMKKN
ncbi:W2 domain, partial [Dillenia turbinata]